MQKRVKNEVFRHFIKVGLFNWSDIAYSDTYKWYSSTNGNQDIGMGHQLYPIFIIYAKKVPKISFLAILSTSAG